MATHLAQSRPRVAILAGGDPRERRESLRSGRDAARALSDAGYAVQVLDAAAQSLAEVDWRQVDVVLVTLHGGTGGDERVQPQLESRRICYTGSGALATQLARCKSISKEVFLQAGLPTPAFALVDAYLPWSAVAGKLAVVGYPLVLKPDGVAGKRGRLAERPEEAEEALAELRRQDPFVLAESLIDGREFRVPVLGRRPLPPLEISPPHADADSRACDPHSLPQAVMRRLEDVAAAAAAALDTRGLVEVRLALDRFDAPWVLEVDTVPSLRAGGNVERAAARVGLSLAAICDWMIQNCLSAEVAR